MTIETREKQRASRLRELAKNRLEGYASYVVMSEQIKKLIANADGRLISTTAQYEETRGSSVAKDALGEGIAAIHLQADNLHEVDSRIEGKQAMLLGVVEKVIEEDALAGRILSLRYMELDEQLDFEKIAAKVRYGYDYTLEKHSAGLDIAARILFPENYPEKPV